MNLLYVALATLLYVLLDTYIEIRSITALIRSVSFWLLWLLFTIFNYVAFVLLVAVNPKMLFGSVPSGSSYLVVLFFSTIGTFSSIQSFSLKFASYKAIDLEQIFERLRAALLSEAASEKAALAKDRKLKLIRKLVLHYTGDAALIDQDYGALMLFGGRTKLQNDKDMATAALNPATKDQTLVNTMVLADERGARSYLP